MALWKQTLLTVAMLAGLFVAWVVYVPSALPIVERYGLLPHLEAIGLVGPPSQDSGERRPGGGPPGMPGGAVSVIAERAEMMVVNDAVTAIGDGQALRSVTLTAEVTGRLTSVDVAAGERVEVGQIIAMLDDQVERIALDRARLVLEDAEDRFERISRLQTAGTATDLQIREAELSLRQAELAYRQAEFDLERRAIRAPIDGWIGLLNVEAGGQLGATTEITRIDDRSEIIIEFRVPERFIGQIASGDTVRARPLAREQSMIEGHVSALDNRVDETSRTMRVQARVPNDDDALRAGMAFSISLAVPGETVPAINPLAIQWGSEGSFVWIVRDGRASQLPVRIVQRRSDAVLVRAEFEQDDLVVTEGVQSLRPGSSVTVQGADEAHSSDGVDARSRI